MAKTIYGNRKAGVLAHLPQRKRLALIAEGLPVIAASATSFWDAAQQLEQGSREQNVLEGFAEEEAAKVLILMDMARCPPKQIAGRASGIVKIFYDHLSRLVYAEAQHWRPVDLNQLREYVDEARKGHYLEGYVGEYIVPNWKRYSRESTMYADIEIHEDGVPQWSEPRGNGSTISIFGGPPNALALAEAMAAMGMFTPKGLKIVHDVWGTVDFVDTQHFDDSRRLTREMLERLWIAKLITDEATDDHTRQLYNSWQMPMYALEFSELPVPLEELEAQREANYWSEVGI